MKRLVLRIVLAATALIAGCEEEKKHEAAPTASSAAPAAIKDEDLPVEADFDDEAEKQISPTNYKSELDTLDKEISAE